MKALSKKELQATLAAVVKRLVENLDVEKIVLFGSYVKGAPTKDSDLDLLVMLNTKKKGIELKHLVGNLAAEKIFLFGSYVKDLNKKQRSSQQCRITMVLLPDSPATGTSRLQ